MTSELNGFADVHAGRDALYNSFSRFFLFGPDEAMYDMLSHVLSSIEVIVEERDGAFEDAFAKVKALLSERKELSGEDLAEYDLEILRNYTRVLCLTDSVPTTESYYTSVEKLNMQDARDEVLAIYRKYRMPKNTAHNENEDFISVELAFLSFMASRTAELLRNGDEEKADEYVNVQSEFIKKHLNRWVAQFVGGFKKYKEGERLYYPLGVLLLTFLREDALFLETCLQPD
ncbi:MAG: molecular chaperone TorD family protein [Deferribacteraceae bacterium]|jgi:TorA maturation chaperone TorD|nr:molecular chaperone TorD family protein [Deferribacteraceae bacterium]